MRKKEKEKIEKEGKRSDRQRNGKKNEKKIK